MVADIAWCAVSKTEKVYTIFYTQIISLLLLLVIILHCVNNLLTLYQIDASNRKLLVAIKSHLQKKSSDDIEITSIISNLPKQWASKR